uniref:Ribonuclease E n=1 Tax=Cliftonaea pectinata TaxID=2007206 RepID=A0A1Z1MQF7_9FLOR|nr:ribonuclease E [Cliftonaea pectinata]ARW68001.1 ribonuclease E [Cliftonaea pectinata]
MVKKIVISHFNNVAAVLKNNKIEEVIIINHTYQVNDIYIGVVQKIFSSINAAFIKLGKHGKSGFIHISDIKPLKKNKHISHITDILCINQLILVQIIKEPTLYKGPRLTANIHLHGKYLVLMPFCDIVLVSHKIYDNNERVYLYSLGVLVKPKLMGLLIKSSAQGLNEAAILQDLNLLMQQWYFIQKAVIVSSFPTLVYKDEDLIKKIVRDFYESSIKKVIVDSKYGLKLLYYYLKKWHCISPVIDTKLQLYRKQNCILDKFYIKDAIRNALKPKIKLIYGGYIIIESYEALTIIDVNSGSFNKSDNSRETILRTNFYAAIEIAYQLKIRNINGVIIIDFIDMNYKRDQLQLLEHFSRLLAFDDAKPQVIELSQLGLLELTRRRRGQSLSEIFIPSRVKKFGNLSICLNDDLYSKLFYDTSNKYIRKEFLLHKNIRFLFFNRRFSNNKLLKYQIFSPNQFFYYKYFTFIDNIYTIYLFNIKASYIVSLFIYTKFVSYDKALIDCLFV